MNSAHLIRLTDNVRHQFEHKPKSLVTNLAADRLSKCSIKICQYLQK